MLKKKKCDWCGDEVTKPWDPTKEDHDFPSDVEDYTWCSWDCAEAHYRTEHQLGKAE